MNLDPLGGLKATYDNHLRLIRKRVVDFVLVLIELFSLGVTAEEVRANIGSAISLQRGSVDPKFQVQEVAPTNRYSSQKNWINDLSYLYIKIGRFVCPTGSVSECRTAGMRIMLHCQVMVSSMPTMQHCGHMLPFSVVGIALGRR